MKLSVSLPEDDVSFLDCYAKDRGIQSRSAALHAAISVLRLADLGDQYEEAWKEFDESGDAALWDKTVGDGIEPEGPWWDAKR